MTQQDRIWFFLHTRTGILLVRAAQSLAPFVGAFVALMCVWFIENNFFPVIRDFQVTRFERLGDQYVLEGQFYKTRPCNFISLNILADPKAPLVPNVLVYQMRDETIFGGDAPTGVSTWGPVSLPMPTELAKRLNEVDALEIRGIHSCHGLWNQETTYGYIPVERIPQ